MQRIWKERDKRKRIARIPLHRGALALDLCSLVEAQVDPADHEAGEGEPEGGVGAEEGAGEHVGEDEDGGEVLDAHADGAAEEGDGVFGDELFEGHEEGGFDC